MPPGRFTRGKSWPAHAPLLAWLLFVIVAAAIAARTTYVADLSAFLPSAPTPHQRVLLEQLKSGVASRTLLIGIEGGNAAQRADASRTLGKRLRTDAAFAAVHNGDNASQAASAHFLFEHRYLLSPAVDTERYTVAGLHEAIGDTLALLGTPAGALIKPVILRDPTGETLRIAEAMLPAHAPRVEDGVWVSRDAPRAVLVATVRADGADLDAQQQAIELVRTSFAPLAAQGLELELSGGATFAVSSRARIQSEVDRLALAGGAAVATLLLLAFGSLRALATALLPVASGVLAGVATVSLGFGQVHGITLGFGTTLIGEAVDYAIYYLIQARPIAGATAGSGAQRWIGSNWPTVRLGLATSLCGFAALVFSGFAGLAQLGVFSVAGLVAAALTTRYLFPVIAPDGARGLGLRRQIGGVVAVVTAWLPRLRWPLAALGFVALLALVWLPSPWRGNLASLSPVSAEEIALDARLRADLGAGDTGTLAVLSAADEAGALGLAEAAGQRLDSLVQAGAIGGYTSPAQLLPSPATQTARRAALPDATTLRTRLAEATAGGPLPAARLGGFIDDVEAARSAPLVDRAALRATPLASALDALLVPGDADRPWRALVRVQPGAHGIDMAKLRAALADLPGAQVLQIQAELDALYARYLQQARLQAMLGALAVLALLALQLRSWRRLWRIVQPLAAAVLIVLAGFTASGVALGILHLVGLLLIVAIGSNYALFFDQLRVDREAALARSKPGVVTATRIAASTASPEPAVETDTLASLLLANLTIVISFGLLATSSIPVLAAIGEVVAPGTLLALVLSAAFIGESKASPDADARRTVGPKS